MGFHSRYVDKKIIKEFISDKKSLEDIFKTDAIIAMDAIATEAFRLYINKKDSETIKNELIKHYGF